MPRQADDAKLRPDPAGSKDMAKRIPVDLNPKFEIEIDGTQVADALGLATEEFRQLIDDRKIIQLCERGTGVDEGLYRTTFYYRQKRARLVVDREGRIVDAIGHSCR